MYNMCVSVFATVQEQHEKLHRNNKKNQQQEQPSRRRRQMNVPRPLSVCLYLSLTHSLFLCLCECVWLCAYVCKRFLFF